MKRLLCAILTLLLLSVGCTAKKPATQSEPLPTDVLIELPADFDPTVTGYTDFSDVLSAALIDGSQNRNLSPVSVYLALAMVTEGAVGDTQAELLAFLGCKTVEELRGVCAAMLETLSIDRDGATLALADSLWMADRGEQLTFREDFLKALGESYRAEAKAVDFLKTSAAKQIADWITEHTHGKIRISEDAMQFSPETVAVLINTIYLKDTWAEKFYDGATEAGAFSAPGGEMTVDYMQRLDNGATIVQGDGFLRYTLRLSNVGRMVFVLPDEGVALSDLTDTPAHLHALLNDGEAIRADISVKLPKFKFQDKLDLKDLLITLGLPLAMSDKADFTGMCDTVPTISRVLQESYIGVDEDGVEAAAYTMVVTADGMMMPEELPRIDFHLTRPFLYVIEHYDGTVLFIGAVTEPTAAVQP